MIDRSLQFGLKGKKGWKEATDKYLDTKALVLAERRKAKKLDLKYANYPIRKLIATGNGSRIAKNRNIPELESELKALDNMIDDLEKVKKNTKSSSGLVVGGEAGAGTGGDVPTEGASSTVTEPTQPKVSDPATPKASEPIAPEVSEPTAPKTTEPIAPEVSEPIAPEVSEPAVPKASEPTTPEVPKEATPDVNPNTADQAVDAQQGEALNKAKEDREEELEENSDKKPTSIESGVEKVNQILDSIIEE